MNKYIDDFDDEEEEEEMEYSQLDTDELQENDMVEDMLSRIRKMGRDIQDMYAYHDNEEHRINVQFLLREKGEKLTDFMWMMDFFNNLAQNLFADCSSEFSLWETREGDNLMTTSFYYKRKN